MTFQIFQTFGSTVPWHLYLILHCGLNNKEFTRKKGIRPRFYRRSFCALNIQSFLFFGIEWQIWIKIMTDKRSESFHTLWCRGGFSPELKRYARYQILLNRHRDGIEGGIIWTPPFLFRTILTKLRVGCVFPLFNPFHPLIIQTAKFVTYF